MPYLDSGRVNQKLRTRTVLVEVAARLIREGKPFTVAEVADIAMVGRTTAYRYFPTLERLLADAALWAATKTEQAEFERQLAEATSVPDRVHAVVDISDRSTTEHEVEYRTMLRLSLDSNQSAALMPKRIGVRAKLVTEALQGMEEELGTEAYKKLSAALSLFIGIEASIVLKDVCQLSAQEAREVKLWGARSVLDAAVKEAVESKVNSRKKYRAGKTAAATKTTKRRA